MCPGVLLALARFIPAGAGNTLPLSALLARNTVYPRWRGEHRSSHYFPFFFDGLSPLARGTLRIAHADNRARRFIPAGAGNTSTLSITTDREPVYPRWRGEHPNGSALSYPQLGLSPLARGTLKVLKNIGFRTRFIPAGAGNTGVIPIAARNAAVYPRWRGEHDKSLTKNNSTPGLSPLARGTHHYFGKSVIKNRFIPAGAGNTAPLKICTKAIAVYPRWRGEHYFCNAQRYSRIGLSPLARGTLAKQTSGYAWCRFIPAGAGNTRSGGFVLPATPVYPRWRGEHKIHIDKHRVCIGLSPLARGTPAERMKKQ